MEIAKIHVSETKARIVSRRPVPEGLIGGYITVEYKDPMWQELTKTVVFKGIVTKDVVTSDAMVTIPTETIAEGKRLYVGFYGTRQDGTLAIPTFWADLGTVLPAADPSGDESTNPGLPVWAEMLEKVKKIPEIIREKLPKTVSDYFESNPPSTGPQGPAGPQGEQGIPGPQGPVGPQGEPGPEGPQGPKGEDGVGIGLRSILIKGNQTIYEINYTDGHKDTITVTNGKDGTDGVDGKAVYTFDPGEEPTDGYLEISLVNIPTGSKLKVGDLLLAPNGDMYTVDWLSYAGGIGYFTATFAFSIRGSDGAVGPAGPRGEQGPAGPQGPQGEQGETGPQGPQGETGPQGPKGDPGEQGPQGPAGADGAPGEKGDKGDKGDPGEQGEPGKDGADGATPYVGANGNWYIGETDTGIPATGPAGNQGLPGEQGPQGEPGKDGENGKDGASATHSWNGTVLTITSASGTSSADLKGAKGDQGATGEQGPKGETGPQGPAGADGKTPVKGTDYYTTADKTEMVNLVLAALPTWTGGSY